VLSVRQEGFQAVAAQVRAGGDGAGSERMKAGLGVRFRGGGNIPALGIQDHRDTRRDCGDHLG